MIKVVEAFSGLGSQAKALENIGMKHKVINTIDWDVNAIFAYDILHNGEQDLSQFEELTKDELIDLLRKYDLSTNGKNPIELKTLKRMKKEMLLKIYAALVRSNNLVNIQNVQARDFKEEIDIFTYSFPCQDLSVSGFWHGNKGGIDRDAGNRSSMLWEVERLLFEMKEERVKLPRFLVMENVTAIRSDRHKDNFQEWQSQLEELGYVNQIYDLKASDFGIPQVRVRTFMISVFVGSDCDLKEEVTKYFLENNLEDNPNLYINHKPGDVRDFLRLDYNNRTYLEEAKLGIPNDTISRRKIYEENPILYNSKNQEYRDVVRTITTKQDRHPNSGVVEHDLNITGKSQFRYLTPRECFLFMGFDEQDYERLEENNFETRKGSNMLTRDKLIKLAGNSIVVNVLESIFLQIKEIDKIVRL